MRIAHTFDIAMGFCLGRSSPDPLSGSVRAGTVTTWLVATAAAVAWGVAARAAQYFARQSFWWDEISVLRNVVHKGAWSCFYGGLDQHQAAPPLFLLLEHAVARILGPGELSERMVPVGLGVGGLL